MKSSSKSPKKATLKNQRILDERARNLAMKKERNDNKSGKTQTFITFTTAHEKYAVNIINVREVQPLKEITFVPHIPDFYLGAVNIRGNILLVMNISKFFKLPEKGITDLTKIIVVQSGKTIRGFLAGEVYKTDGLKVEDIRVTDSTFSELNERYIQGLTKDMVIVLNIETILNNHFIRLVEIL